MQSHFEPYVTFLKLERKQSSPCSAKTYQVEPEQRLQQPQQTDLSTFAPFLPHLAQQLRPPLLLPLQVTLQYPLLSLGVNGRVLARRKVQLALIDAGVPECFQFGVESEETKWMKFGLLLKFCCSPKT